MNLSILQIGNANEDTRPCYESLTNNVSTPLLRTTLNAWPEGTRRYVNHRVLKDYIQDTSRRAGVDAATIYGALVTRVFKNGQKWHVVWSSLREDSHTKSVVEHQQTEVRDTHLRCFNLDC